MALCSWAVNKMIAFYFDQRQNGKAGWIIRFKKERTTAKGKC